MTPRSPVNLCHVCFEGKPAAGGRVNHGRGCGAGVSPARCSRDGHTPTPKAADSGPSSVAVPKSDCLARWIIARAGLDAEIYRHQPLERRLSACLRMLKVSTAAAARRLLNRRPELLSGAASALLIGVTEFFRDSAVFDGIRNEVIPKLRRRRGPLRVWSTGCSTGNELYSVAILLAEAGLLGRSRLLGTDCRPEAIAAARTGLYGAAALGSLSPEVRGKYFEAADDRGRPVEALRRASQWKTADLARAVERGPWDIILWRNVAIYLNTAPAAAIWARLADELAPGGYLIVGKAERPPAGLDLLPIGRCTYRKNSL
jgi:chemotaxis protein methyltransferase CheR